MKLIGHIKKIRNKVISINPNGLRSTSIELRERIWNVFYKEES